ncbi:hypothetical protein, partial [Paenibacillus polymyxa]|uniref:hypothetical protein n=1 Tax=Paenibacillus polymyxa TaxID=1406 RepID=UPI001C8D111F
ISLFDFANKINLLTRCSVFKDQAFIISYFVSSPHLSGDFYNISSLFEFCKSFFNSFFEQILQKGTKVNLT